MKKLTEKQGAALLQLARAAIAGALGRPVQQPDLRDPAFAEAAGTFVTLKLHGQLRGCIGNIEPIAQLQDSVHDNAVRAAFHDYRFVPLSQEEFDQVDLSLSVLTEASRLFCRDADELLARLRPNVDGVILRHRGHSATFLPQVWEQLPETEQFLTHLCLKAGLTRHCWRESETEIYTYQVQAFAEERG